MLEIGLASRDFTPDRPALLHGQMYRRIAREARDPLTVNALAVASGDQRWVMVSCDLCMVPVELLQAVRDRLAKAAPELPANAVLLCATHTHTSLLVLEGWYNHPGGDVMTTQACLDHVADRIAEAAAEAWAQRKPRKIARAWGHAVVGHNRRAVYADGSARMYGKTDREDFDHIEGTEDHSVDLLAIYEPDGALAGVLLAVPCPSQVDEHLTEFSADYWHEVREELRRLFGPDLAVIGLCAAGGDQSPHFLLYSDQEAEMRQRRGLSERQEIARRLGRAVSEALDCTEPADDEAVCAHRVQGLELPAIEITRERRDQAQAAYEEYVESGKDPDGWWPRRNREMVEAFDAGRALPPLPMEMHGLRLGGLGLVTNPFELFLDYALRIKARSPAPQTAVIQLTNGRGMYLPTARALAGGHYSAMPAVCTVGPRGGDELVAASLAMLGELFPAES